VGVAVVSPIGGLHVTGPGGLAQLAAMGTWNQLMEELTECERQLVAVRLKAEEKKVREAKRLEEVLVKRQAMVEVQEKLMQETKEEFETSLQGIVEKAQEDIKEAATAKEEAVRRREVADEKADAADLQAKELERQILALNGWLDTAEAESDRKYSEVRRHADDVVREKEQDTCQLVREAALYASEVQEDTLSMMATMQEELQTKVSEAQSRSEERSRFKALHEALLCQPDQNISADEFFQAKGKLIQAWLDDWVSHTHKSTPRSTLNLQDRPDILKPSSPDRARSVDRARRIARDLKRGGAAIVGGWGEYRPQTAP